MHVYDNYRYLCVAKPYEMKKLFPSLALAAAVLAGCLAVSCKNNPKTVAPEPEAPAVQAEEPAAPLTFADVAGIYDDAEQESRVCLGDDGTATWNMIGSLHFTEFTYVIRDNGIYLDDAEATGTPDYTYDPEKKTLTDGDGTVYFLQPEL